MAKCKELGIEAFVFYIVGLPGETRETFLQTLEFAKELDTPFVQFLPLIPYPGTAIEKWGREHGFIAGQLYEAPHYGTEPIMRNEALSINEIKQLCEMAYRQLEILGLSSQRRIEISKGAVVLAKCTDYAEVESAIAKIIDNMGGMEAFVKPGDKVLIKPNLIGSYPPEKAATTHPSVVQAIVKLVQSAGGIPFIGDSPGGAELASYKDYQSWQEITRMTAVSYETNAEFVDFSKSGVVTAPIDDRRVKSLTISKAVMDADVIISLPKAKTHAFTYFTGAIKNLFGVVPGLKKAEYHQLAPSQQEFSVLLNDIHDYLRPKVKLIVMDGVVGMEGDGPTAGQPQKGNFLLGGMDSLTVDVATCAMLGLDYKQSPPLVETLRRRGWKKDVKISVLGDNINEIDVTPFTPPLHQSQASFIEMYGAIKPQIDIDKCKECQSCVKSCPVKAISDDFVIDWDRCIRCLCCFEMCKNDAVNLVKVQTDKRDLSQHAPSLVLSDKMRILVISNLYPPHFVGGYELACKEITDKLKKRGYDVMVLTSMFGLEAPAEEYSVKRVMDHSYGNPNALSVLDPPLSAYNEYIVKKGIAQFQPNVIYLWNFHGLSMQSVMAAVLNSQVPYVFHAMDYHLLPSSLPQWQKESARVFLSNERCQIIAMSEVVRKKFLEAGYTQTHLVYHGVEIHQKRPLAEGIVKHGAAKDNFKLMHAGQIRHDKGVHILLGALLKVKETCPEVSLDIFGSGDKEYESKLSQIIQTYHLPVTFHGPLQREELLKKYADYDAFVFPTLREEPFGIVMIEAMSDGLPVIAPIAGGPAEVIIDGETGLLFKQGDADELAEAIIKLRNDPHLYTKLSENSLKLAKEKFDIQNSASKIEKILSCAAVPPEEKGKVRRCMQEATDDLGLPQQTQPSSQMASGEGIVPRVVWESAIYGLSGYAQVARNAVLALSSSGIPVQVKPIPEGNRAELPHSANYNARLRLSAKSNGRLRLTANYNARLRLSARNNGRLRLTVTDELEGLSQNKLALERSEGMDGGIYICHYVPTHHDGADMYEFYRAQNPGHKFYIGSTMFETDRIPQDWVAACNKMDELWVPTQFNLETFSQSGVSKEKIQVIPFGIQADKFNPFDTTSSTQDKPSLTAPLDIPHKKGFNFLSVFEWTERKGCDILLRAYVEAFDAQDDVCLILRAYCRNGESVADKITEYLSLMGYKLEETPDIVILEQPIPDGQMPQLYAAVDAFVLPSRGEGWGMPYMEAMAMELPTIGTRWSGNLEFMDDENSYLIDIEGLVEVDREQAQDNPFCAGHKWAQPSLESTKRLMRTVFENPQEAKQKGKKARQDILNHWTMKHAIENMVNRLQEIAKLPENGFARLLREPIRRAQLRTGELAKQAERSEADPKQSEFQPAVLWHAPIFDHSGYADEARNFVITFQKQGGTVRINPITKTNKAFVEQLNPELKDALFQLTQTEIRDNWVNVVHSPAYAFTVDKRAIANVGRVMFETDRLPDGWAAKCNRMDEIWVPTDFNMETFAKAGVHPDKLVKVPSGIDLELYNLNVPPLQISQQHGFDTPSAGFDTPSATQPKPQPKGFTFLSVFQWIYRKGWDVLFKAYIEEFSPDEDVCLVLRTYPINENSDTIVQDIEKLVTEELQRNLDDTPDIIILDAQLKTEQMSQLYAAADAFVLPSRGEGWGRPYMEAMAMELPTIGTRWSGNTEFMNDDNSYLIDVEELVEVSDQMEIPFYRGHKWAEPSVEYLRKLMRYVYENRDEAKAKGKRARQDIIENYSWEKVSEIIIQRLGKFAQRKAALAEPKGEHKALPLQQKTILWEGSQFVNHSLALVNRELCIVLAQSDKCELSLIPYKQHQFGVEADPERFGLIAERLNKPLSRSTDFHIRHQWPPKFEPPEEGYWILMQPWEYGSMPKEWLPHLRDQIDEVWVYSNYNRDCYIQDGLDPDKVAVVPLSVDHTRFHPNALPLPLIAERTDKSFKFLFVGGTIWRKGIDVLLNAYTQAFTREDDVCLIIKDIGQNSFYAGQTAYDLIKELQSEPNAPQIIHLTKMLPQEEMPQLYAACDCLVHPYRGEGFCLPVAEAMATGKPVIVTKGGACDDFCGNPDTRDVVSCAKTKSCVVVCGKTKSSVGVCTDDTVYWISASRVEIKAQEKTVNQAWVLEPDLEALVAQMRHVAANPGEAKTRGKQASEYIRQTLSWEKSAELILERLAALEGEGSSARFL